MQIDWVCPKCGEVHDIWERIRSPKNSDNCYYCGFKRYLTKRRKGSA